MALPRQLELSSPIPEEKPSGVSRRPVALGKPVTDIVSWAATAKKEDKPVKKSGITKQQFDKAMRDAAAMMKSGDFSTAKPLVIYALYCLMHEAVYGIATPETTTNDRRNGCFMVSGLLRREFNGDVVALVDFVRWSWNREVEKLKWAKSKGFVPRRLSARIQFSNAHLADYRHAMLHGQTPR